MTDETGTGALVFGTSPTLTTPNLGTPSTLVGTNITGTAASLTAGTVTTNANLTGMVTSVGNAASLGSFTSANLSTALTDETGSGRSVFSASPAFSGTATFSNITGTSSASFASTTLTGRTKLTNASTTNLTIGGKLFDSTNSAGTAGQFLKSTGTGLAWTSTSTLGLIGSSSLNTSLKLATLLSDETGSGAAVFATSPTLVTPILGTPTSVTLTNATGLPISTGVSGLGANVATFLATPSSANLITAVTDETGTGALVFGTSPTLTTPNLGTPSTLVGTNITGTAASLTAGTVTTNANLTGMVTSVGNAASLGSFTSANLSTALTNETGSGVAVFGTAPTMSSTTITGILKLSSQTASRALFTDSQSRATTTALSATLLNALTDETGTGVAVFATSPTISGVTLSGSPTAAGATWTSLGTVTTADINGGTIDGVTIGGASAGAITGTTITANTGFMPDANDGAYLGQSGTAFSDLFLASGGVINFNAGDVTLTHAADTLTLAGGTFSLATSTQSGLLTLSGTAANIALGSNYLSGDGGDEGVFVDGSGNVGIGNASPSGVLHLSHTYESSIPALGSPSAFFNLTNGSSWGLIAGTLNTGMSYIQSQRVDTTATAYDLLLQPNGGQVGIGTSNPTYQLSVISPNSADTLYVGSTVASGQALIALAGGAGGLAQITNAVGDFYLTNSAATGNLILRTVNTERMRITSTGNIGIGDTTPDNLLDIASSTGQAALAIYSGGTDTDALIKFELTDNSPSFTMGIDDSDSDKFKISGSALGTNDRLVIDSSGNIGIATSSPSRTLTVAGSSYFGGNLTATGTVKFSALTASRALFTDSQSRATTTALSATLLNALTDETGTGVAVFATSPTISGVTLSGSPTAAGATWTSLGTVTTADINGGTIDGVTIGGASAGAITGTTITANTGFMPDANDGAYLGQSGTAFSDLFLASGGVINFNAGDVTLTHAADTLTLAGGTFVTTNATTTDLTVSDKLYIGSSVPFSDAAGTLTLQNIDAIDATTETTLEAALDALANLTTVGTITSGTWNGTAIGLAYGGMGANVSGYTNGLFGLNAGTMTDIDTESELETALGALDVVTVTASDISSANLATILSDETGTGIAVFGTSPTFSTGLTLSGATAVRSSIDITTSTSYGELAFKDNTTNKWGTGFYGDTAGRANDFYIYQYTDSADATVNQERFTIDTSGNIGIGTASPSSKLTVAGNVELTAAPVRTASAWTSAYDGGQEVINTLVEFNGKLYAGQGSSAAGDGDVYVCDPATAGVATDCDNASDWTLSYAGTQEGIFGFAVYQGKLYAGQGSSAAGDGDVYVFDGSTWSLAYDGAATHIYSLAVYDGNLYAGQGGTAAGHGDVFQFDGTTWTTSLAGSQERIRTLTVYNGNLYAGQGDTTASGDGDVLEYDGTTWGTLYDGAQESILALGVYDGKLYAGQAVDAGDGDVMVLQSQSSAATTSYNGAQEMISAVSVFNGKLYAGQGSGSGDGDIYMMTSAATSSYAMTFTADSATGSLWFSNEDVYGTYSDGQYGVFKLSHALITNAGAYDVAEDYPTTEQDLESGDILAYDQSREGGYLKRATRDDKALLAGVVSTQPGFLLASKDRKNMVPTALVGRVPVKVTNEHGAIAIGDSVTISEEQDGYGAKANFGDRAIGYALASLDEDTATSTILVYVTIHTAFGMNPDPRLLASSTDQFIQEEEVPTGATLMQRLTQLATSFIDGVLSVAGLKTDELCIGDTCVNEAQLIEVLDGIKSGQNNNDTLPTGGGGGTDTDGGGGDTLGGDGESTGTTTDDGTGGEESGDSTDDTGENTSSSTPPTPPPIVEPDIPPPIDPPPETIPAP